MSVIDSVNMSQFKVLPSYTDLTSLHDFHQVPVLFSAQVPQVSDRLMDLDTSLQVRERCL